MTDYQLTPITVTKSYREAVIALYSCLNKKKGYWELLEYLMYGNWRDEENSRLIIPSGFCAKMEGKKSGTNYSARQFLQNFSDEIAPIIWSDWTWNGRGGKSRCIISVKWCEEILALTATEKCSYLPHDRVWLVTGKKYRREDEIAYRRQTQTSALTMMETAGCQEAFELLSYLNNLAPNKFTSIKRHLDEACEMALKVSCQPDQQLRILKSIEAQAQPFYKAVDKTTRIFALNQSFLGLKREVREVMTQEWISCDLRSAQLAIVAKVWKLPEVEAYLRSRKKIWPDLCDWMEIDYNDVNKSIIKDILYSIIFGAGIARLRNDLASHFGNGQKVLKRLQAHPIINALFRARAVQLKKIKAQGWGIDAFGKKHYLNYMQIEGKPYRYDSSRSILALIAQAYELKLLSPVIKMALESTQKWSITMWLHDGFCIDVRDKRNKASIVAKLQQLVKDEADSLGVYTELEVSL